MSKDTVKKDAYDNREIVDIEVESAELAPEQPKPVAKTTASSVFAVSAIRPTRIKIAYGVSKGLPDGIPEGSLVIGDSTSGFRQISRPGEKLNVIICEPPHIYWKEYRPYTPNGPLPRIWSTEADAIADGMITRNDWNNNKLANAPRSADIFMLLERPDSYIPKNDPMFFFNLDGKQYAFVVMTVERQQTDAALSALAIILMNEANSKNVPVAEVSLSHITLTLEILSKVNKRSGNKSRYPSFNIKTDEHFAIQYTTDKFLQHLRNYSALLGEEKQLTEELNALPF